MAAEVVTADRSPSENAEKIPEKRAILEVTLPYARSAEDFGESERDSPDQETSAGHAAMKSPKVERSRCAAA